MGAWPQDEERNWLHPGIIAACAGAGVLLLGGIVYMLLPSAKPEARQGPLGTAGAQQQVPAAGAPNSPGAGTAVAIGADLRGKIHDALAAEEDSEKPLSTAEIVARCEASVALVKGRVSSGTGFLVAPGLLATNSHVIDDEFIGNLQILFPSTEQPDHGPFPAELLYEDRKRDLAFLALGSKLPALKVANAFKYRKGEDVTVIGNPGDGPDQVLENAISRGVMSTKVVIDGQDFYQLSIAVNPGNSGGPVFDPAGRVIGVVTLKSSDKEGVAFCIPNADLRSALGNLAGQSDELAGEARSKHRLAGAFKALVQGGVLYVVGIFVHRGAAGQSAQRDESIGKIEEFIQEMEKRQYGELGTELSAIQTDPLVDPKTRGGMSELFNNFKRLQTAYGSGGPGGISDIDLNLTRSTYGRLIEDLRKTIGVEVSEQLMLVLQAQGPARPDTNGFVVPRLLGPRPPGFQRPPFPGPASRLPSSPYRGRVRPRRIP